jgi:hypothetical protein
MHTHSQAGTHASTQSMHSTPCLPTTHTTHPLQKQQHTHPHNGCKQPAVCVAAATKSDLQKTHEAFCRPLVSCQAARNSAGPSPSSAQIEMLPAVQAMPMHMYCTCTAYTQHMYFTSTAHVQHTKLSCTVLHQHTATLVGSALCMQGVCTSTPYTQKVVPQQQLAAGRSVTRAQHLTLPAFTVNRILQQLTTVHTTP